MQKLPTGWCQIHTLHTTGVGTPFFYTWVTASFLIICRTISRKLNLSGHTCTFNISRKFNVLMHLVGRWMAMLGCCQSAASATPEWKWLKLKNARQLLLCLGSYRPTINGRLLADHGARLRLLPVRAMGKKTLVNARDSAYDFTVKLSLFMCSHSSCLGWRNVTACDLWHLPLVRTW